MVRFAGKSNRRYRRRPIPLEWVHDSGLLMGFRPGNRGAAFGPATVRRLRGQSSRFEERMDRTHEVTFVGGVPGEDGAAESSLELDVRRHVGVSGGIEVALPRRPWPKGHGEASH